MVNVKRITIVFLLIVASIITMMPLSAGAEEIPKIKVSESSGKPGESVTVDVLLDDNPGINSFTLAFDYDTNRLSLDNVEVSSDLGGQFQYAKKAVWLNSSDTTYNGKILTLSFTVLDSATNGDAYVAVTYNKGDICNYDEEDVDFSPVAGKIAVSGSSNTTASTTATTSSVATSKSGSTDRTTNTSRDTTISTEATTIKTVPTEAIITNKTEASETPTESTTITTQVTESDEAVENIVRIAGVDRISTAVAVSKKGWKTSEYVILANAFSYPDALSGATLSKKLDAPIMLADRDSISNGVVAEIERLGAKKVIILGGTAAISDNVENDLSSKGVLVARLFGDNRNGTAAAIAEELCYNSSDVYLVSNANFADALSVSSVAAISGNPILYVNPDGSIPDETMKAIGELKCSKAYVIGGPAAIGENVSHYLNNSGIASERVYGDDRYATSLKICDRFKDKLSFEKVSLATGKNFPDALAGAAFAAKNNMPVILVGDAVGNELSKMLTENNVAGIYAFGGTSALSEEVTDSISSIIPSVSKTTQQNSKGWLGWLFSCKNN